MSIPAALTYRVIDYECPPFRFRGKYSDMENKHREYHDFHMDAFEDAVNDAIVQGWVPLGPPSFDKESTHKPRYMYQAMMLDLAKYAEYLAKENATVKKQCRKSKRLQGETL